MNIDAQMMVVIPMVIKAIVLIFALVYTFILIRGIVQVGVYIAKDHVFNMSGDVIIIPAILWGVFYLLVELTKFL